MPVPSTAPMRNYNSFFCSYSSLSTFTRMSTVSLSSYAGHESPPLVLRGLDAPYLTPSMSRLRSRVSMSVSAPCHDCTIHSRRAYICHRSIYVPLPCFVLPRKSHTQRLMIIDGWSSWSFRYHRLGADFLLEDSIRAI